MLGVRTGGEVMATPAGFQFRGIPLWFDDALRPDEFYIFPMMSDYDKMRQVMLNNLWDNNPGELDRWADDGGRRD